MRSHAWKIALSLCLTAVLLFFFLKGVDPKEIQRRILEVSPAWLAGSLGLGVLTFLFRALRWTWILRPVARVRFFPAFRATAIGFAANNLPGKVGEVLRPALLAKSEGLPFSPLLASVVLERIFDGASVIFFLLIALWNLPEGSGLGLLGVLPVAVLILLAALILFCVFRRLQTERLLESLWRRLPARLQPKAQAFATTFVDGFASLRSIPLLLAIVAGSLGMWFVINLQIYSVLRAFDLDLPLSASFLVTAAAVLGLAVPTPGGLGSYQAAVDQALQRFFHVAKDAAAGVAILAWVTSFVLITLIGLFLFVTMPGRKKALRELAADPEEGRRKAGDGRV